MGTMPTKRTQFETVQNLMDEYRRISENGAQALALVDNIARSLAIVNAESDLNQVFTQEELDFLADTQSKITAWQTAVAVK